MFEPEFQKFISKIAKTKINPLNSELCAFGWKDYTIINDKKKERKGMDILIDLTQNWSANFGGNVVYVDGTGNYTKIGQKFNSITIVLKDSNSRKFIQYVNNLAGKTKMMLLFIEA